MDGSEGVRILLFDNVMERNGCVSMGKEEEEERSKSIRERRGGRGGWRGTDGRMVKAGGLRGWREEIRMRKGEGEGEGETNR